MQRWAAHAAVLATALACTPSHDVRSLRFRCADDQECIDGWVCDRGVCSATRARDDAGAIDGGDPTMCELVARVPRTCGFDARFDGKIEPDWLLQADARCTANGVVLTPSAQHREGSIFYRERFPATHFRFETEFAIADSGGTPGADGIALAWSDEIPPPSADQASHYGVLGVNGYVLVLDSFGDHTHCPPETQGEDDIALYVNAPERAGISGGCDRAPLAIVPAMIGQTGRRRVELRVDLRSDGSGIADVAVELDDVRVMTTTITGYELSNAYFGAGAGTGAYYDVHTVYALRLDCE